MKYLLRVLTSPSCWIRSAPTNKELDAAINKLLDAGANITANSYTTTLGPLYLWTANFPYDYGRENTIDGIGLPSRKTVFRLYDTIAALKDAEISASLSRKMKGTNENQKNA